MLSEESLKLFEGKSKGRAEPLGFAQLTVASAFVIGDIRLVKGKAGRPLVVFPRRGFGEGAARFYPVVSALSDEAQEAACAAIVCSLKRAEG